ncbi:phospholipid-transporting ATPase ABCA7 [Sorex fumeus]|uniref:phospholipid-transporting ATPase ABCA7 n=1 Tax=Sorex fumeus TaxID=62283 RepID=UPI0024AD38D5|nr:phospholipid-transporting ATPase ABCA7 [Sorex fumeus]
MAFWTQLKLLLWKNLLYRKRQPIQLLVELLWPLFLFFILVAVRQSHLPVEQHECHFNNKPLPSAGIFRWLQGLICSANNTCFPVSTPGEEPGVVSNFNDSLVSRFVADILSVLERPSTHRMLDSLGKLMPTLNATAWPQVQHQLKENPAQFKKLLDTLLQENATLGLAQEAMGDFVEEATDLLQEVLTLPSLLELRTLLQKSPQKNGVLEVMSVALCSAKGPGSPRGLSLSWYEDSDTKDIKPEPALVAPDKNLSPACEKLLQTMEGDILFSIFWRRLKPLVLGKVLFTPDTAFTRQLMAQVNQTFQEMALLKDIQEVWQSLGPQAFNFLNDSANVALLQKLLKMQNKDSGQPGPGGKDMEKALHDFLDPSRGGYSWLDARADLEQMMGTLGLVAECMIPDKLEAVPTEEALVGRALKLLTEHSFWAGVVFLGLEESQDPDRLRIKIRMNIDEVTETHKIRTRFWDPGPAADPLTDLRYVWGGFVYLQDLLERAAVRVLSGAVPRTSLYVQQMPYPCYVDDTFLSVLGRSLPLFLTLAWIYSVAITVKAVVREKEKRLRDTMRAMGLSRGVLWLGWFLSCIVPFLISAALLVLVLKLGDILPYSHPVVLFLFFASFALATVIQSFLLSVFFSQANLAAACGGLAYFVLYLPYVLLVAWRDQLPPGVHVATSLLSPVAFGFGCESLALLEEQGTGAQWRNLGTGPAGDVFSLGEVSLLLVFDALLYSLLTWYLEAVYPGQYGIPEPWNFPFRRSYWFGPRSPKILAPPPITQDQQVLMEEAPPDLTAGVSIRGLEKRFPGNPQPALRGLSLDFYCGHITAFLGHNGAGKTTTMSILTGLFPPTGGSAFILGHDIQSSMEAIRPYLGICPQYNVLFDRLTVAEHVWFYGRLKGLSASTLRLEQSRLLGDVGLTLKYNTETRHLSGGMQRKLSVAIAFVGGSKVVFLDEPTAGVDPASRRSIWELLLKYREGRALILSTHHLDEAELLGDRVAIMAAGRLCCCGSPLFLRRHLGSGYYLTLVKAAQPLAGSQKDIADVKEHVDAGQAGTPDHVDSTAGQGPPGLSRGASQLLALVQRWVPGGQLVEVLPHELVLTLPYAGAQDGSFAALFQDLDLHLRELGLSSYGISDTSMEEIFLKVIEESAGDTNPELEAADGSSKQPPNAGIVPSDLVTWFKAKVVPKQSALENGELGAALETQALQDPEPSTPSRVRGRTLILQQLQALFLKRFLLACRSRRSIFAQIILPALFVGLALAFSLIVPPFKYYPELDLNTSMYSPQTTFFSDDTPGDPERSLLLQKVLEEAGWENPDLGRNMSNGNPCIHPSTRQFSRPKFPEDATLGVSRGNGTLGSPSPACQCSRPGARRLLPDCPVEAGWPPPPQVLTRSGEIVQNLTGRNLSDYLVKTYPGLVRPGLKTKKWVNEVRYGGFSLGGPDLSQPSGQGVIDSLERLKVLMNLQMDEPLARILQKLSEWVRHWETWNNLKVWFNNKGWHAMVAFVNRANNALLHAHLPPDSTRRARSITTVNHPLNLTKTQMSEAALVASSVDVLVSICVVFAMSFVPASFTLVLIEERTTGAKHLQFMGGLPPTLYWFSNFLWDMCNYLVSACIVVVIFLAFQRKAYVAPPNLLALVLLLLLYGWSITPLMYPASFFFTEPSTAYVALTCINLFIGINGSMATFVLELLSEENLQNVNRILKRVFLIFPHFCLGRGLIDMVRNQAMADVFEYLGEDTFQSPLRWDVTGKNLLAMLVQGPLFLLVTLLLQHRDCLWPQPKPRPLPPLGKEDEDVARERQRVTQGAAEGDVLVLKDLTKVYRGQRTPAVNRLCLGIPPGECFGLLGVNGAGKTTTFRMVTGDMLPSRGEAVLAGHSVAKDPTAAHLHMGYCPQFDAIFPQLTAREHLQLFARLRGIPEAQVAQTASRGLVRLGLQQYADRPAGTYSGGNKRKLATAVALVGEPAVIFLDEPTTGMDPGARRFLWNSLLSVVREGRSVVLTSHSMEECEALCTRLAIMVNGRFRCLGSVQHLKNRFGSGYTLTLRVPAARSDGAQAFVAEAFPGAQLREAHGGRLSFQLPLGGRCTLAHVFGELAARGAQCGVEDFSVSQTTLEEVFLYFSEDQGKEDDQEGEAGEDEAPGPQRPKFITQFLDDRSEVETVL